MNSSLIERIIMSATVAATLGTIFLITSNRSMLVIPLLVIFGNLFLVLYILLSEFHKEVNRIFSFFVFSIIIWSLGVFIIYNIDNLTLIAFCGRYLYAGVAFIPSTFLALTFVFPRKSAGWNISKKLLIYTPSFLFVFMLPSHLLIEQVFYSNGKPGITFGYFYPAFAIYLISYFIYAFYRLISSFLASHGQERTQLKYLIIGLIATITLGIFTNLLLPLLKIPIYTNIGPLFIFAIISIMSYVILKNRIIDLYSIFQKTAIFLASSAAIVFIYLLSIVLITQNLEIIRRSDFIIAVILAAFIISVTYQPIFESIQKSFLKLFFKSSYSYQTTIQKISRAVSSITKFDEILNIIIPSVVDIMDPKEIAFLVHDKNQNKFKSLSTSRIKKHLDRFKILEISGQSDIVSFFKKHQSILIRSEMDEEIINKLGISNIEMEIWTPVILKDEIVGFILLGRKMSQDPYSEEDINMLTTLANHIALSYENASLYEDILNIKNYSEMILNHISYPIITTNLRGEINTLNSASQKMFGFTLDEIESQNYKNVFKGNNDLLAAIDQALEGKEIIGLEGFVISKEKASIPVSISATKLFDIRGRRIGLLIVLHDLSAVKKLEDHVRRSDKLAALGTMAAGMAHEIKNPLSSMKVLTQLMEKRFDEPEYRQKFSEIMPKEIGRIDKIVESLLGYARTNSPKIEQVQINEVIDESLNFLNEKIKKNNISAVVNANEIPAIWGDSQHFLQVFVNLILNAVQSMPDGGRLNISTNFNVETNEINIIVKDTGCGIPKEDIAYLFDPFFTTKYEGTGLGLTIVHGIIDAHNGRIEVESENNKGSIFRIYLPVKQKNIKKIKILKEV